jgi:hypothetical protein
MYQVKIRNTVYPYKDKLIAQGDPMVDENDQPVMVEQIDQNGDFVLDGNGDPITVVSTNETGSDITIKVFKTEQEKANEEQALIDAKTAEIQAQCDAYMAAQENQRQNGGPGPVASEEIMKICNEHDCQFEIVFKEVGE